MKTMLKEQFVKTDRLILNYFVPFTNGKFVASCLMWSNDVCSMISHDELNRRLTQESHWTNVEYNDIQFWWKDHTIDWFNDKNWFDNITESALTAVADNQYCFYTCHEDYSVTYLKRIFPNAKTMMIIPDKDLCKQNYLAKNWIESEPEFETSRVYKEFSKFKQIATDLVINQTSIFNEPQFVVEINNIANKLNIVLDLDQVLAYRNLYLKRNEHISIRL